VRRQEGTGKVERTGEESGWRREERGKERKEMGRDGRKGEGRKEWEESKGMGVRKGESERRKGKRKDERGLEVEGGKGNRKGWRRDERVHHVGKTAERRKFELWVLLYPPPSPIKAEFGMR